jgi:hypothetical protein
MSIRYSGVRTVRSGNAEGVNEFSLAFHADRLDLVKRTTRRLKLWQDLHVIINYYGYSNIDLDDLNT